MAAAAWAQESAYGHAEAVGPAPASANASLGWDSSGDQTQDDNSKTRGPSQSPGIIVDPTDLWIPVPDGAASFNIRLATEPGNPVTVLLAPSNQQCNISRTKADLTKGNWDRGVDITVSASLGSATNGEQICIVQTGPAVSSDPAYNGLESDNVTVFAGEIIPAGIIVDPTSLEIREPAGSAVFTIALTVQPQPAVTLPVTPSNNQCTVSPTLALMDTQNWSSGMLVTVTAVDDGQVDGDQECVVKTGPPSSGDPGFEGLMGEDLIVTVIDTDIPPPTKWAIYLPLISLKWPPIPGVPVLQPIDNADGDGDYAVTWKAVSGAETYTLEESESSAFDSAVEVYSGTATSYSASGQTTGRHYYRVRARNSWGDSAWSNSQAVDVLWELEPNNEASMANGALVSGLGYRGRFPIKEDDYDYYYFDLSTTRSVELWLRDIPAGHDYNLVLRDANLGMIGYSAERGAVPEHIVHGSVPPGRYYVQVWNYVWQEVGSTQAYELQVSY
jgi:hypothetical protein